MCACINDIEEIEPRKRVGVRPGKEEGQGKGGRREKEGEMYLFCNSIISLLTWQITPFWKFHQEPEEQTMPFSSEILLPSSYIHSFCMELKREIHKNLVFGLVAQKTEASDSHFSF